MALNGQSVSILLGSFDARMLYTDGMIYDSTRARYRTQRRDPRHKIPNGSGGMMLNPKFFYPLNEDPAEGSWYDYDPVTFRWRETSRASGDSIMSDFGVTIDESVATLFELTAHEPGLGQLSRVGDPDPHYTMGNLIGTTEAMTDGSNEVSRLAVYTAYGELIDESGTAATRYGYAGAWGYQSAETSDDPLQELGWLHVGARTYDPAAGRFMQRDPIGIAGGMNTYVYVGNSPVISVDPSGLFTPDWHWENRGGHTPGFDPKSISQSGAMSPFESVCLGASLIAFGGPVLVMGGEAIALTGSATATGASVVATSALSHEGFRRTIGNAEFVLRAKYDDVSGKLYSFTCNLINRTSGGRIGFGYDPQKGWHFDRLGQ